METTNAETNAPLRFELTGAADLDRYMLYSNQEIQKLLGEIGENTELVTLYFDSSKDFVLTSVLAVSELSVILDCGMREDLNRRVLTSAKLVFITSRDKIKVQWISGRAERVSYDGKPAFRIAIPRSLLRLQRREYYRLSAPVAKPLACLVPAAGSPGAARLEFTVTDISLGGLALNGPLQQAAFEIGKRYEGCEIALPGLGTLTAAIAVANIFEVTTRSGARNMRSGCQFVDMQGKMLTMLQRYINRIERERHERMARFG